MVCQKLRAEENDVKQLMFDSPLSAGLYSIVKAGNEIKELRFWHHNYCTSKIIVNWHSCLSLTYSFIIMKQIIKLLAFLKN